MQERDEEQAAASRHTRDARRDTRETDAPHRRPAQRAAGSGSPFGLPGAAGNRATTRLIQTLDGAKGSTVPGPGGARTLQRQPAATVSFDTPEVVTGHVATLGPSGTGGTVATRCSNIAAQYDRAVNLTRDNAMTALDSFETYMSFPAEAEAEADLVGTATKFALKEGFKALWEWAVKPIEAVPGVGQLADLMIELVEECDRAETAAGRVKVRDWILDQRGSIQTRFHETVQAMGDMGMNFERGYAAAARGADRDTQTGVAATSGQGGTAGVHEGDTTLAGPGAEYLNRITRAAQNGLSHAPTWQSQLQSMIERWVMRNERTVESRGGGDVYMGGRIYLTVRIARNGDDYTVTLPTTGHLASPEAGRTADALKRLLTETNQSVNDLAILKVLTVEVEDEVWGFNDTYRTVLHYRQPSRIEHRGPNFGPRVTTEYLEKADRIVPEALRHVDLTRINVRELSSAADA